MIRQHATPRSPRSRDALETVAADEGGPSVRPSARPSVRPRRQRDDGLHWLPSLWLRLGLEMQRLRPAVRGLGRTDAVLTAFADRRPRPQRRRRPRRSSLRIHSSS